MLFTKYGFNNFTYLLYINRTVVKPIVFSGSCLIWHKLKWKNNVVPFWNFLKFETCVFSDILRCVFVLFTITNNLILCLTLSQYHAQLGILYKNHLFTVSLKNKYTMIVVAHYHMKILLWWSLYSKSLFICRVNKDRNSYMNHFVKLLLRILRQAICAKERILNLEIKPTKHILRITKLFN